jgi:Ni/Fe-hydrogenase subunit HybB-like protein
MTAGNGRRPAVWSWILFCIVAAGIPVALYRLFAGLGATTNLTDRYPWGLWKAFNVVAAIGLGAAGFTTMGIVHVLGLREFRSLGRLAVLAAFLAYLSAAVSLAVDIGRPWAIWHPIVMWNPHSVLFEVAWCLMLYTVVLVLEGSGMLFERMGWDRLLRVQHAVTVPVVIAGVILSTLHQSSLGALFLIIPGKLHPLWYTKMLPLLFFLSAVAVGLSMVIVLSRLAIRRLGARIQTATLADFARILLCVLAVYGQVRLLDLVQRGVQGMAFGLGFEALMFELEFLVGVVLPVVLLAFPIIRERERGLFAASLCVVFGFVANRLNVAITGIEGAQGGRYIPSAAEILISLLFVALAILAFRLGVRLLAVFPTGGAPSRAGATDAA